MDEWYDNKQIYEMLQQMKSDMSDLRKEMAETRTLIRDYNDLRQKVEDTASRLTTLMWGMPVVVTVIGLLIAFLNYIGR